MRPRRILTVARALDIAQACLDAVECGEQRVVVDSAQT